MLADIVAPVDLLNNHNTLYNSHVVHTKINSFYPDIVNSLLHAANTLIPVVKTNFFKFSWDDELSNLKTIAIESFKCWNNAGKPRDGLLYDNIKKHKMRYKQMLRMKEREAKN